MNVLEQSCHDILIKNLDYANELVYILYDTESPLAKILSNAYIAIAPENSRIREFKNPPQPLYRGGLINPDNPHKKEQNRVITSHNIEENKRVWLTHHTEYGYQQEDIIDPEIESIKDELLALPMGSIVVLIQSTNFRLSTFRIRLELFHRGVHVIEFNHLAYIPESEYETFQSSLVYRTNEYTRLEKIFRESISSAKNTHIYSQNGSVLNFGLLENIRWNTGDYRNTINKWGTFPIGEIFTESINLDEVSGRCLVESYPNEDFSVNYCIPFELVIAQWRALPSSDFPPAFAKLYNWIIEFEWEVMVRELGFWLNPAITTSTPLSDINFYERKIGVHLSLGKKHGIYGKKLPKTETQRFHIDVFLALDSVIIGDKKFYEDGMWIL